MNSVGPSKEGGGQGAGEARCVAHPLRLSHALRLRSGRAQDPGATIFSDPSARNAASCPRASAPSHVVVSKIFARDEDRHALGGVEPRAARGRRPRPCTIALPSAWSRLARLKPRMLPRRLAGLDVERGQKRRTEVAGRAVDEVADAHRAEEHEAHAVR